MPTKRTRISRHRELEYSDIALWYASDQLWGDPGEPEGLEHWKWRHAKNLELWNAIKDELLPEWIESKPGTRPSWWWAFDAPPMSVDDVERGGWISCESAIDLKEPRQRLGGTGNADFEALNVVPFWHCGIPTRFLDAEEVRVFRAHINPKFFGVPLDPNDPPRYEAQASYLKRHGLLLPGEERRLRPADFEAETVTAEEEGE